MPTAKSVARKVYRTSPATYMEIARNKYGLLQRRRPRNPNPPVTREFLRSGEYEQMMFEHAPCTRDYGLHEAHTQTESFRHRAFRVDRRLRAWRWRGVQERLDLLLDVIPEGNGGLALDLGGGASPFGLGSLVVDLWQVDADGDPVRYHSLDEVGRPAEVILSSHTLEHIPDLDDELERLKAALKPGGTFVAFVPSYTCERWRAKTHSHSTHGDHVWTFGLSETTELPEGLVSYRNFDEVLRRHFTVAEAAYCGDDSIFALCENR